MGAIMLGRFISAKRYAELLVQGQGETAAMRECAPKDTTPLFNESRSAGTPAFRCLPSIACAFDVMTGSSGIHSLELIA
jgi:hypothetical protein